MVGRPDTLSRERSTMGSIPLSLRISWNESILSIQGTDLFACGVDVNYLEAFCRAGSHDREWKGTLIRHKTVLLSGDAGGTRLHLETELSDGCVVSHAITSGADEIDFHLTAHNPTDTESEVHWAQPCIRVGAFTGFEDAEDPYVYIRRCFVFLDNELARMPTPGWNTSARYTPGQVWCPRDVPRTDVNPRPLNALVPSNGLIGCFSRDDDKILATAWEPYQELFQGVLQCIHSDFRVGGLKPGESKHIRGKIYIVGNDVEALLHRYKKDFPEHAEEV